MRVVLQLAVGLLLWACGAVGQTHLSSLLLHRFSHGKEQLSREEFHTLLECSLLGQGCPPAGLAQLSAAHLTSLARCHNSTERSAVLCGGMTQCLSLEELVSTVQTPEYNASADWLPVEAGALDRLLPLLVSQSQLPDCWRGARSLADMTESPPAGVERPSTAEVWGYGLLSVAVISGISLLGGLMLPLIHRAALDSAMTVMTALAAGSLAASALFHLLPQSYFLPIVPGTHDYLFTGLHVLCGLWMFLLVERAIKCVVAYYAHSHGIVHTHSHTHSIHNGDARYHQAQINSHSHSEDGNGSVVTGVEVTTPSAEEMQVKVASNAFVGDDSTAILKKKTPGKIKTVAWMIVFGDAFHNFLDGVSIGAAFSQSLLTGFSISLAVVCEELPHELGDFAVLLNSGMSMKQALIYNFLSALTCFMGLVVGILIGELPNGASVVYALAGGMFLYIALVDMLPELNESLDKACDKGQWRRVFTLIALQNLGLIFGVMALFVLAYYQDSMLF